MQIEFTWFRFTVNQINGSVISVRAENMHRPSANRSQITAHFRSVFR